VHGLLVPECRNYRARNPEIFFLRELRLPEPTCLLRPPLFTIPFHRTEKKKEKEINKKKKKKREKKQKKKRRKLTATIGRGKKIKET
jgi:hypothetical protein